jgi:hypothetical protein
MTRAGFPHSDTLGSQLGWQLPQAYRGLPRPSSAPGAKASTVCSRQLDHKDARVHCAILKQRPAPASGCRATPRSDPGQLRGGAGLVPQGPSSACSFRTQQGAYHQARRRPTHRSHHNVAVLGEQVIAKLDWPASPPLSTPPRHSLGAGSWTPKGQVLLRKEVIQPHLPVRLPCYDFVPIASPTFDGSLP